MKDRRIPDHRAPRALLVVEADEAERRRLSASLASIAPIFAVADGDGALAALDQRDAALAVVSLDGTDGTATDLLLQLRLSGFEGPILAVTARASLSLAVEAMRAGASDILARPWSAATLVTRVEALLAQIAPVRPAAPPRDGEEVSNGFHGFLGASAAMQAVYDAIRRIAPSRAPVFITGESGTGKEVAAEAIHALGGRRGAFVALNCGAIPRDLMESEIFGHARGAFTGAHEARVGAAETADGGVLFLDEIGEMDMGLQAKLLRFIQTGEFRRVGETATRRVDVRFLCATNREPLAEIEAGRFREDLYYRLCVLPLHLPPLRARDGDAALLASHFLRRYAAEEGRRFEAFEPEALDLIARYPWPGNVRQLQNVARRLVVMNDGVFASAAMLPLALAHGSGAGAAPAKTGGVEPFWRQEKRIIEEAIAAFGGNLARAAAALEISPSTIYRKKEAWAQTGAPTHLRAVALGDAA